MSSIRLKQKQEASDDAQVATQHHPPALPTSRAVPARHPRGNWFVRSRVWPSVSALLVILITWQLVTMAKLLPTYSLPTPLMVGKAFLQLGASGSLWRHVSTTLSEAILGFIAAFVVSAPLGYILSRSPLLSRILAPYIAAVQAMPLVALAPLLVLWFGLGLFSKVIICALIVFFPILVNTMIGLRTVERDFIDAAATQGAGQWQTLWYVQIPLSLRVLLGGVRMGLTLSLTGAIVGEFVASESGLGFLMQFARTNFDSAIVFVAALTMTALAVICYLAIGLLEYWLIDWD